MTDKKYYGYDDPKALDARITAEQKKMNDLVTGFKKIYDQLVADRKANCVDFVKPFMAYVQANVVHTKTFQAILDRFTRDLANLDADYGTCLKHLADVPCQAIGQLPIKYSVLKKVIKSADVKQQRRIMDLEWDRLETCKLALMHFANANMYLHARASEIYSTAYESLRVLNFETEFPEYDKELLSNILSDKNIQSGTSEKPTEAAPKQQQQQRSRSAAPPTR